MKRTATGAITILICIGLAPVFAQNKKKKVPTLAPASNVAVIAPPDDTLSDSSGGTSFVMDTGTITRYFLFPEFYSYWPITKGDTIIRYQCYDEGNSYINIDTLHNINDVKHIQLVKVFTNFLHTYIDEDGQPKPSAATKIIFRYDKTDDETWKSYEYGNAYVSELKEHKSEIVRQDTTAVINSVTGGRELTVRKYYKVTELKHKGEVEAETDK